MSALSDKLVSNREHFSKVPEVTAFFWIVKALTTAMGESTSDFLVHSLVPEIAVVLGGIAFCIALYIQFGKDRYVPWAYWLAVAMVGVFGTMAADVLHVGLGVPYIVSTVFYAIVLAVVFRAWYVNEGTLSIHSIVTPRRELFYWAAVLATFALGTAAGDLTAVTFGLGYFGSILLFLAIIAIPALGYFRFGMNSILAFWFAYVVTRPVGASVADWLSVSSARGGLALGTGPVSLVLAAAIAAFVYYLAKTGRDTPADQSASADDLVSRGATAGVSA
ncbi:MAG TPA: hypothetical protein VH042_04600 [Solirubrobacterales bacterium]|jgi:uncharacterized membrane-anchored protein|nr:hypothetical protein [Solirubrobacterales bacterium]